MEKTIKFSLRFILLYLFSGFILNFIWEYLQCSPFFIHNYSQPTLNSMIMATFGDLIIMAVILFLLPLMKIKWHELIKLEILATTTSLAVELYATKTQRWFYTNSNILLPWIGVSIFPLLQMMIIVPISFKFATFCSEKT